MLLIYRYIINTNMYFGDLCVDTHVDIWGMYDITMWIKIILNKMLINLIEQHIKISLTIAKRIHYKDARVVWCIQMKCDVTLPECTATIYNHCHRYREQCLTKFDIPSWSKQIRQRRKSTSTQWRQHSRLIVSVLKGGRLKYFCLKSGIKQGGPFSQLLDNTAWKP